MSSSVREARRVVLCDDHEIVREAIKARMANSSTVEIVGEAGNGRDVVDVVKELEPDVLIIDVELPKRDGIEATKEVLRARPRTKVIIFRPRPRRDRTRNQTVFLARADQEHHERTEPAACCPARSHVLLLSGGAR